MKMPKMVKDTFKEVSAQWCPDKKLLAVTGPVFVGLGAFILIAICVPNDFNNKNN